MSDEEKKRIEFLLVLHEMAGGDLHQGVLDKELAERLNLDSQEFQRHAVYLKEEGLVNFRYLSAITISHAGRKEAERIMAERYAEKETRVLKKIYEMTGANPGEIIVFDFLVKELGMSDDEVTGVCIGLEQRGLIEWPGGDVLQITAAGIDAIESVDRPKRERGGDIYNMHIGTLHGGAQQGPGGTQNIYNNEPISEIIPQLTALIEKVRTDNFQDKDDVLKDLEIAHQVALANPSATAKDAVWTRIQTKLTAAKTTMELAGIVCSTYPYWPQVIDFFARHIR